jgi:HAD superfamily hydrolase (TIGR01662 family)
LLGCDEADTERAGTSAARVEPDDLYPDARDCVESLKRAGYLVGIAGNFGARTEDSLRSLGLPIDVVASAQRLGVEKPSPDFFRALADLLGIKLPREAVYVGDRVDTDIEPARRAGFWTVRVRRGPWAILQDGMGQADAAIGTLDELTPAVERLAGSQGPVAPSR